jgi:hypothetical protein
MRQPLPRAGTGEDYVPHHAGNKHAVLELSRPRGTIFYPDQPRLESTSSGCLRILGLPATTPHHPSIAIRFPRLLKGAPGLARTVLVTTPER